MDETMPCFICPPRIVWPSERHHQNDDDDNLQQPVHEQTKLSKVTRHIKLTTPTGRILTAPNSSWTLSSCRAREVRQAQR